MIATTLTFRCNSVISHSPPVRVVTVYRVSLLNQNVSRGQSNNQHTSPVINKV